MLSLTALFFIKESGLVTGLLLGVSALIGLFNKNKGWKDRIYPLVSVLVPCVLIGIFFLVQKHVNGWYFFPYHYSLITLEWAPFWYSFKATQAGLLFTTCYRHFYFFLLLALSLLAAVKNKNLKYLVIFIPAILVYFLADNKRAQIVERMISSIPLFILFLLAVTSFLYALISLKIFKDARQQKMAILIVLFILYFNCFSAINFFTLRYILSVLVPLLFFLAILFNALIECTYPILFYPLLILIISLGGHAFYADTGIGDCNPGAFDAIDVEQHMAGFMEKNNYYTRPVTTAFLNMTYLTEPDCGYLSPGKIFSNVRPDLNDATDLAIFDNISCDESVAVVRKDTTYQLAYRYEKGHAWIEVYARKR